MSVKSISTLSGSFISGSYFLPISPGATTIYDIEGNVNSTTGTNYYIQLLGTNTPTSGNTVPLYSRLVVAAAAPTGVNGFSFVYRPNGLDTTKMTAALAAGPIYVAISTTDTVWTNCPANTDVTVTIEDGTLPPAGGGGGSMQVAGDLTTSRGNLLVFADPGSGKKVYNGTITNNNGSDMWMMLFAYASPATGATPLQTWFVKNGATVTFDFGSNGYSPSQVQTPGATPNTGCYFYGSTTAPLYTSNAAPNWKIQAYYQ